MRTCPTPIRRLLGSLLALATVALGGCYGAPSPPVSGDEVTPAAAEPAAPTPPPVADPTAQGERMTELGAILERLGDASDEVPAADRPGAEGWRAAELDKLVEVCVACCTAGPVACRACLEPVAQRGLPADELWGLLGKFLGPLAPRANDGATTLGANLLLRADPAIRDRAFRILVGSRAARRGQADAETRRASTVPLTPRAGERVVVVVEKTARCGAVVTDRKGPDANGRIDLEFDTDCPPPPPPAEGDDEAPFVPRATRAVWAFDAGPLPVGGLELWLGGAEEPLLTVRPAPEPAPGK